MDRTQIYSNNVFDRAVELREIVTQTTNISWIPIFKEQFFLMKSENINSVLMDTPVELISLSDKKYFLGVINDVEIWCIDISEIPDTTISIYIKNSELCCIRDCFHLIKDSDASLLAYAKGIVNWNSTHQFCNNCGSKTVVEEKGHRRKCQNDRCNTFHFLRINPAVIVLIVYKQEGKPPLCLLNMAKKEYGYMCSLFAGFSEIGESLEDTVRREVKEEVAVLVNNIMYITSQPWSFPSSMMLGFTAETKSKEFNIDNKEIKKAQWFSAVEINQMVQDKKLVISKKDSISNYIITQWVEQNS
jgi:NAD+ diphosphatase